ncbi:hypothetical protein IEO21_06983 [Rhodonia placenta]|uniref:Uncharacterized protein n=1 Tax=Rhodonia placenta TaxID=104341 RepID=A0A8H7NZG1_9APHY|nr:hypothetical protein IEO21_06983 [Postia placenta]
MTESFKTLISTTIGWSLIGGFFSAIDYMDFRDPRSWEFDRGAVVSESQYFLGGIMMILVQLYVLLSDVHRAQHYFLSHPGGRNVTFGPMKQGEFIVEAVDSVAVLGCVELGAFAIADIEIAVALCLAMWNERTGFMRALELVELGTVRLRHRIQLNARDHWREGGPSKHMNLLENIRLPIMTTQDVGHSQTCLVLLLLSSKAISATVVFTTSAPGLSPEVSLFEHLIHCAESMYKEMMVIEVISACLVEPYRHFPIGHSSHTALCAERGLSMSKTSSR